MKLKLMIALVILALVSVMILAACDDGELPTIKEGTHETILDIEYLGSGANSKGEIQNPKSDTTVNVVVDIDKYFP